VNPSYALNFSGCSIWRGKFPRCSDVIAKYRSRKSDQVIVQKMQAIEVQPGHFAGNMRGHSSVQKRPYLKNSYRARLTLGHDIACGHDIAWSRHCVNHVSHGYALGVCLLQNRASPFLVGLHFLDPTCTIIALKYTVLVYLPACTYRRSPPSPFD
jgi:hypothetical protein